MESILHLKLSELSSSWSLKAQPKVVSAGCFNGLCMSSNDEDNKGGKASWSIHHLDMSQYAENVIKALRGGI